MMLLCGTLPYKDFPLSFGEVKREGDSLVVEGRSFLRTQGTGAMLTAALSVTSYLNLPAPYALVSGDIGDGKGTREMFGFLTERVNELNPRVLVLHYCLPIMSLVKRLCQRLDSGKNKPFLIADAGGMYAAKASKMASYFDIFTPDPSEMAYLADPEATHPAYVSKYLFSQDVGQVPSQIAQAYKNRDAAKLLIVKGKVDYIAMDGKIVYTLSEPDVPALEPIGGTGDTITGLVSGFIYAGYRPLVAAVVSAKTNRVAGLHVSPTPATPVREIADAFPGVLQRHLSEWIAAA